MREIEKTVRNGLLHLKDTSYREFHAKLIPNIEQERIIGVRTPVLRKFAKELLKEEDTALYLECLPHYYYEENNIHAVLIEGLKDYRECIEKIDRFLPYVDNWATCDMMNPKVLKRNTEDLICHIDRWISSKETYAVRFSIKMLMDHYLGENYKKEYSDRVANVRSEEYYIKMMISWYFATALAKNYEEILPYLIENRLDRWCHNKTIQKAVESYRITPDQKDFLKTLKRKDGK